ncbi:hypothetical protein OROHE_005199 [Orobanche hederae]
MGRRKSKLRKQKTRGKVPAAASPSLDAVDPPSPPWIELPADVTANILQRLGAEEILESAQKVCTTWRKVCGDPSMWRVISLKNPERFYSAYDLMCRNAVDRSQGRLIDLTLDYFGDDNLINYIANRSSHLGRLTLNTCYDILGEGLAEAVKKLPHLEELHIICAPKANASDIEAIGISCPMLKSFTFNQHGCKHLLPHFDDDDFMEGYDCNDYALAIAKTMPNLRHLRLFANWMKNEGLQAILDGCSHLESLDLRYCFGLDLGGALGKRCSQQIKDLKRPSDSISDIWWVDSEPECSIAQTNDSDLYPSDYIISDVDYDYYGDYEVYDDYTSPLGFGLFGGEASCFLDD